MKLSKPFPLLVICCLLVILSACVNYKARRTSAFEHIDTLRENVLLFRLKTENKKIEALEKYDDQSKINEINLKLLEQNKAIFKAFEDNFKFSKVYFFAGNEAKYLRKQAFDKITLYDVNQNKVINNNFLTKGYLIAAVDYVHEFAFVGTTDTIRRVVSATSGFPSLVLMDKDFVQIDYPFPRRVLNRGDNLLEKKEVLALDIQLFQFYERYQKYKIRKARRSIAN